LRLSLGVGAGPYPYRDTVPRTAGAVYSDEHGVGAIFSAFFHLVHGRYVWLDIDSSLTLPDKVRSSFRFLAFLPVDLGTITRSLNPNDWAPLSIAFHSGTVFFLRNLIPGPTGIDPKDR